MKGSTPTKADKALWDALASLGCAACRKDGIVNPWVSIHHLDGRTKPGCHQRVLALCGPHHQQDDSSGVWAVHPNKARFEQEYGTQEELLEECKQILGLE
jgi:hypothetical protein